jgi:hypothetical protein
MAVDLDDGGVDDRIFHVWIFYIALKARPREGGDILENTGLHPIAVAREDCIPIAEYRRQIAPWAARPGNPEHCFQKHPIVAAGAAGVCRLAQAVGFHRRPLGVRQAKAIHRKLLSEIESLLGENGNPDSQQALARDELKRDHHSVIARNVVTKQPTARAGVGGCWGIASPAVAGSQ